MKIEPIAVLVSDLHLSHTHPKAREGDWYAAMRNHLRELRAAMVDYSDAPLPLIVAGDVFDTWSVPPEIISFAIRELPKCWAIPGQHDLPNHSYDDIMRSGYWSLVEAGIITNLKPGTPTKISSRLSAVGVPWGFEIPNNPKRTNPDAILLAVVHAYIWDRQRNSYDGAPQDKSIGQYVGSLSRYDAAVFGDNHKGFLAKNQGEWGTDTLRTILNSGGFMRRKSDDAWTPKISWLYSDGSIKRSAIEAAADDKLKSPEQQKKDSGEVDMSFLNDILANVRMSETFLECVKRAADDGEFRAPVKSALRRIWQHVQERT